MIERPEYALVTRVQEGTETQVTTHNVIRNAVFEDVIRLMKSRRVSCVGHVVYTWGR
jgi:hypothetical protein